ncbi:unnamed protein product [Mesocestoides corti]|uniref:EGF-like domain-containing protein n=4 Tax=Mesocestoides corti TaxID=53468 RepID=A0A0R3U6W9_MESCO|nr:unnamed protein product [Mesocestoides corti]
MEEDGLNSDKLTTSRQMLVNMHRFLEKFMRPRKAEVWEAIMARCGNNVLKPEFVRISWVMFWNAIRKVDIQQDWNEWNPFWLPGVPSPFKSNSTDMDIEVPDFVWNSTVYVNQTETHFLRDWHALVVFNLFFCEHPHFGHTYLCPDSCFGRRKPNQPRKEIGNPCAGVKDTRTSACTSKPEAWSGALARMWWQLENPTEALTRDLTRGSFSWIVENRGCYACDCDDGYGWNDEELFCDKDLGKQKYCDPVTLKPCLLPGAKSCRINDVTGEAICTCHPQYTGNFCEKLRDPCYEPEINVTLSDGKRLQLVSGQDMCQIDMAGHPSLPEYKEVSAESNATGVPSIDLIPLPRHSKCFGKPGSDEYFCRCEAPFVEDVSLDSPNCLLQVGSCDSKLCLHGTCVTTANQRGKALCMCYPGFDGPHCDHRASAVCLNEPRPSSVLALKVEEWTVWSSCKPACGRRRRRTRTRVVLPQEENHPMDTIRQIEVCPPRLGNDCAAPGVQRKTYTDANAEEDPTTFEDYFITANPEMLKLQALVAATAVLIILFIQILRSITFMLVL